MNRTLFIFSLATISILGYFLLVHQVHGSSIIILLVVTVLTVLRRKKLNMRPYFGGTLRDIILYFKMP